MIRPQITDYLLDEPTTESIALEVSKSFKSVDFQVVIYQQNPEKFLENPEIAVLYHQQRRTNFPVVTLDQKIYRKGGLLTIAEVEKLFECGISIQIPPTY